MDGIELMKHKHWVKHGDCEVLFRSGDWYRGQVISEGEGSTIVNMIEGGRRNEQGVFDNAHVRIDNGIRLSGQQCFRVLLNLSGGRKVYKDVWGFEVFHWILTELDWRVLTYRLSNGSWEVLERSRSYRLGYQDRRIKDAELAVAQVLQDLEADVDRQGIAYLRNLDARLLSTFELVNV